MLPRPAGATLVAQSPPGPLAAMTARETSALRSHDSGALAGGRGVGALFAGWPATGKRLAAPMRAARPVWRLERADLSVAISKYLGETERKLARMAAAVGVTGARRGCNAANARSGTCRSRECHVLPDRIDSPGRRR